MQKQHKSNKNISFLSLFFGASCFVWILNKGHEHELRNLRRDRDVGHQDVNTASITLCSCDSALTFFRQLRSKHSIWVASRHLRKEECKGCEHANKFVMCNKL